MTDLVTFTGRCEFVCEKDLGRSDQASSQNNSDRSTYRSLAVKPFSFASSFASEAVTMSRTILSH